MDLPANLGAIAGRYDVLLCDVWGVIHNGRRIYPAAAEALQRARKQGVRVLLVSNVPKPSQPIWGQLDRFGFPRDAYDGIVTSGDAIRFELAKRAPGPMYKIGPEQDRVLWEGLSLDFTHDLGAARFIGISGLDGYDKGKPEDYADVLKAARAYDIEMLCANPDIVVRVGDHLVWCAGAVARDYAAIGGRVVMAGKPHPPIYALALEEAAKLVGRDIDKARVLAIGDGVGTDVIGANGQGIDCLFIASGMHGEALKTNGALDPAKVEATLAAEKARARYVMPELI